MPTLAVLADTHWHELEEIPPGLGEVLRGVDLILHAGDLVGAFLLDYLGQLAPVYAVCGNCDPTAVRITCPGLREFEVGGVTFGMLHGHQVNLRDPEAVVRLFSEKVQFIVHGHTHLATHDQHRGVQIFSPGSLSEPRGNWGPTWGRLIVEDGMVSASHVSFQP